MNKYTYTMVIALMICFAIIIWQQREIKVLDLTAECYKDQLTKNSNEFTETLTEIDSLIRKKIEWYESERKDLYGQLEKSNKYLLRSLNLMEKVHKEDEQIITTFENIGVEFK